MKGAQTEGQDKETKPTMTDKEDSRKNEEKKTLWKKSQSQKVERFTGNNKG